MDKPWTDVDNPGAGGIRVGSDRKTSPIAPVTTCRREPAVRERRDGPPARGRREAGRISEPSGPRNPRHVTNPRRSAGAARPPRVYRRPTITERRDLPERDRARARQPGDRPHATTLRHPHPPSRPDRHDAARQGPPLDPPQPARGRHVRRGARPALERDELPVPGLSGSSPCRLSPRCRKPASTCSSRARSSPASPRAARTVSSASTAWPADRPAPRVERSPNREPLLLLQ